METVKSAVMAVCVVSAVKCLVESISAATKLKNQLAMILNLLLAVVMLSPFSNGISAFELPGFSEYEFDYNYSDDACAEAIARESAENIAVILSEQTAAAGISCEKIEVEVNILPDYSISISSVTVTSEDFQAVAEIIRKSLGDGTEVLNAID